MQAFVVHCFPGLDERMRNGDCVTRTAPCPIERLEEPFGEFVVYLVEEPERGMRSTIDQFPGHPGARIIQIERNHVRWGGRIYQRIGEIAETDRFWISRPSRAAAFHRRSCLRKSTTPCKRSG